LHRMIAYAVMLCPLLLVSKRLGGASQGGVSDGPLFFNSVLTRLCYAKSWAASQ